MTLLLSLLQLHRAAVGGAAELLKYHADQTVLKALKVSGEDGNLEGGAEYSRKLTEQKEQLVEVRPLDWEKASPPVSVEKPEHVTCCLMTLRAVCKQQVALKPY